MTNVNYETVLHHLDISYSVQKAFSVYSMSTVLCKDIDSLTWDFPVS